MTDQIFARRRDDLLFGVRRSIRYHARRRQFFDRWHMSTSAAGVIFGSAAMAALLTKESGLAVLAALIVTALSAVDLVVGTARMARLHEDLGKRFLTIEEDLIGDPVTSNDLILAERARLRIEADEPPALRVLDTICHNDVLRSMGEEYAAQRLKIGPVQRFCAQLFDLKLHRIELENPKP